ncbi:MAG: MATE family efflux transporter [Clostridia bacterium]|nr:MATE family efflux transporter [Clostridia bacterium]
MDRTASKTSLRQLIAMIAALAFPVALQNLLTTTGSMIDTMMIASLGEKSVGAVGLCAQFSSLMFSSYWGFVGGGMLFFAQYWGAQNHDGIRRSYGLTLSFMLIPGILFGYFAIMHPELVMALYTDSPDIRAIGILYLQIVGFSYPLQVIASAMAALLRSIERVKIPMVSGIASVVTNCICNYILIFGKLGLPAMGVRGAALGTVIANLVNVLIMALLIHKNRIPYVLEFRSHFRWSIALIRDYIQKCFPILLNEVFIGIGNTMINIVLGHQVDEAIAATAVLRTLEGMVIGFFGGFSSAASVLVGKEVGAGNHEEAYSRGWRLIYLCCGMIGIVGLCLIALHTPILHMMGLSGPSFRIATGMLIIYCSVALIRMQNWCMNDTYRSAGDSAFGSLLEILFMFLLVQPIIHIANDVFHAPFLLVFLLCYVDEPIRYVMMQHHMYSKKWTQPVSSEGIATIGAFREKYHIGPTMQESIAAWKAGHLRKPKT